MRQISAVAASSMRLYSGTQPRPPSQASRYCTPTTQLCRRHASVRGPLGTVSRSAAPTCARTSTLKLRPSITKGLY